MDKILTSSIHIAKYAKYFSITTKKFAEIDHLEEFIKKLNRQRSHQNFEDKKICPVCEGAGSIGPTLNSPDCSACKGSGFVDKNWKSEYEIAEKKFFNELNKKEIPLEDEENEEAEQLENEYLNDMEDFGKF